jgi:hypothetical protein
VSRSTLAATGITLALLWVNPAPAEPEELPRWELFPTGHLYPAYIADPLRPTFAVRTVGFTRVEIPDSGAYRFALSMGGRFPMLRFRPDNGWVWQFHVHAGFYGQFDMEHRLDNVGWDGLYGFVITARTPGDTALRIGARHFSSHLGDEYLLRTGRERLRYTREELALGISRQLTREWRLYGEAAWAYEIRTPAIQDPWRAQLGVEHQRSLPRLQLGPFDREWGWFAAAHGNLMEERDWRLDLWVKAGLTFPSGPHTWRLGAGYKSGRVPIGEFNHHTEDGFFLGLWFDF